jgi:hypothetical protein
VEFTMRLAPLAALSLLSIPQAALAADNAVRLDGSFDWVELGTLDPGTDFTVEGWLLLDDVDPATG